MDSVFPPPGPCAAPGRSGRRRRLPGVLGLLVALAVSLGCCAERPEPLPLSLSLAVVPTVYSGLVFIAEDQGFFRKYGLAVELKTYASGLAALKAMAAGEAEAGTGSDFAFTGLVRDDAPLGIVSSIGLADTNGIVARRDRGIAAPEDLRGKRIGLTTGTTGEYYLDKFLQAYAMRPADVSVEHLPAKQIVQAVVSGQVDAIASWDNYVYETLRQLGENGAYWPGRIRLDFHWLVATPKGPAAPDPEKIDRLLRALLEAERFMLADAERAKAIISRRTGVDPDFTQRAWQDSRLYVSLGQALVTSLEDCFRWRMKKQGNKAEAPNVLHYIDPRPLDRVDQRAITLLR